MKPPQPPNPLIIQVEASGYFEAIARANADGKRVVAVERDAKRPGLYRLTLTPEPNPNKNNDNAPNNLPNVRRADQDSQS